MHIAAEAVNEQTRQSSSAKLSRPITTMSGLEVAGVVLGSIPILLAALELGGEALGNVQRLIGHKAVIYRYLTILQAEEATFRNTLIFLLDDVVSSTSLQSLLEDPGGEVWQDKAVHEGLRDKRLGDNYDTVLNIMRLMNSSLKKFTEKIGAHSEKVG
jgi:hypothetical protein